MYVDLLHVHLLILQPVCSSHHGNKSALSTQNGTMCNDMLAPMSSALRPIPSLLTAACYSYQLKVHVHTVMVLV